jgi:hypothetical protein
LTPDVIMLIFASMFTSYHKLILPPLLWSSEILG